MKTTITALLAGLIFGLGLLLSGMANPQKVLGFLDLAGNWDPSLGLVMFGAIAVGLPIFQLIKSRGKSLLGKPLQLPTTSKVDRRLVIGSLLFGIGWGLAGFCPGPAIVATGTGQQKALLFTLAMLAGMGLFHLSNPKRIQAAG
ncbi:YeeE/YedE family protein [Microbulbifer sp. OS29]|uniref:YeeE/YedE family protein n=1 Tax=Microbulbifer okhotskensis TaxID=2926617 RepID=A0A9X2J9B6_9GAMM|nr:YeeE/YedE family protein [Microbulbifer okhotskensis]MCO1336466.1 YeeE/YedE family protein [Microbulbifer okhotskensis]